MREVLKHNVNSETGRLNGNGIMCGGHKKTRKFKKRDLCDLLRNGLKPLVSLEKLKNA